MARAPCRARVRVPAAAADPDQPVHPGGRRASRAFSVPIRLVRAGPRAVGRHLPGAALRRAGAVADARSLAAPPRLAAARGRDPAAPLTAAVVAELPARDQLRRPAALSARRGGSAGA